MNLINRSLGLGKGNLNKLGFPKSVSRTPLGLRAFTLVELMVILAILSIVVALAIPLVGGVKEDAKRASADALVRSLNDAMDRVRLSTPSNDGSGTQGLPPELSSTNVSVAVDWLYKNGYLR